MTACCSPDRIFHELKMNRFIMLLDHFHPPLKGRRHSTGFHSRWAGNIAVDLNKRLPEGWFAEPTVHWGIEVDVATFEEESVSVGAVFETSTSAGWELPTPTKTIDFSLSTDVVEVRIHHDFGDVPLVGVVELISPSNKDRPESRDAFVSKCDTYLRDAIGLVLVDVVTDHHPNLHSALMDRLGDPDQADDSIYTSSYRPTRRDETDELDIWYEPLRIGGELPTMPLVLKNGPQTQVNLADTYSLACEELRIPRSHDSE